MSAMTLIGLAQGCKDLWKNDELCDLKIKVGAEEIKAHKFVLASVSDYVHEALLKSEEHNEPSDAVTVTGVTPEAVLKTLEFVYTCDDKILASYAKEILGCAIHLKMPGVIDACTEQIVKIAGKTNWLSILSTFDRLSLQKGVAKIMIYVSENWTKLQEKINYKVVTLEQVKLIIENWRRPERELFEFLGDWIQADKKRMKLTNDLMSQVRWGCLPASHVSGCMPNLTCDFIRKPTGAWKGLVEEAGNYHKLPINKKILCTMEMQQIRNVSMPAAVGAPQFVTPSILDEHEKYWRESEQLVCPYWNHWHNPSIVVNNYLIIEMKWRKLCVLNPRNELCYYRDSYKCHVNLAWETLTELPNTMQDFTISHFKDCLYIMGGRQVPPDFPKGDDCPQKVLSSVYQYDIGGDRWEKVAEMLVATERHATCVYDGCIYVSGGGRQVRVGKDGYVQETKDMDYLDMSTFKWHNKACMNKARQSHKMTLMNLCEQDVLFVIDCKLQMEYFTPTKDQWTILEYNRRTSEFVGYDNQCGHVLFKENTIYFLAGCGPFLKKHVRVNNEFEAEERNLPWCCYSDLYDTCCTSKTARRHLNIKWDVGKAGEITETLLPDHWYAHRAFWAMLAVPINDAPSLPLAYENSELVEADGKKPRQKLVTSFFQHHVPSRNYWLFRREVKDHWEMVDEILTEMKHKKK